MYRAFEIKNFRGFRDLSLDALERVNLIAGQNNVGKTALLEAIFQHIGANNPELSLRVNSWRGIERFKLDLREIWGYLFYLLDTKPPIEISSLDDENISRILRIFFAEADTTELDNSGINNGDPATAASFTPEIRFEYQDSTGYSATSRATLSDDGVKSERGRLKETPKGLFIATHYRALPEDVERFSRVTEKGNQEETIDTLRLLEPRLQKLLVLVKGGVPMIWGELSTTRLLPIGLMGEGLSRLLSITLAIMTTEDGCVLIDEIENGLHYSVMGKVWGAIAQAARQSNVQIFATTHSWECICAAHEAFSQSGTYDFRLHRLDRVEEDIKATTYTQEMLDTAIKTGLEVR